LAREPAEDSTDDEDSSASAHAVTGAASANPTPSETASTPTRPMKTPASTAFSPHSDLFRMAIGQFVAMATEKVPHVEQVQERRAERMPGGCPDRADRKDRALDRQRGRGGQAAIQACRALS
jgi:hypothetical protein